jgi:hypothetical protein
MLRWTSEPVPPTPLRAHLTQYATRPRLPRIAADIDELFLELGFRVKNVEKRPLALAQPSRIDYLGDWGAKVALQGCTANNWVILRFVGSH